MHIGLHQETVVSILHVTSRLHLQYEQTIDHSSPMHRLSRKEVVHMEIDAKIARVKELIARREQLDAELSELLGGVARERRMPRCSTCGEPGHRASTCPSKPVQKPRKCR